MDYQRQHYYYQHHYQPAEDVMANTNRDPSLAYNLNFSPPPNPFRDTNVQYHTSYHNYPSQPVRFRTATAGLEQRPHPHTAHNTITPPNLNRSTKSHWMNGLLNLLDDLTAQEELQEAPCIPSRPMTTTESWEEFCEEQEEYHVDESRQANGARTWSKIMAFLEQEQENRGQKRKSQGKKTDFYIPPPKKKSVHFRRILIKALAQNNSNNFLTSRK